MVASIGYFLSYLKFFFYNHRAPKDEKYVFRIEDKVFIRGVIFEITKKAFVTSNPHKVRFLRYNPAELINCFFKADFIE